MRKVYADHSATTKPRPEVIQSMLEVLENDFGNPSSIHQSGRKAKKHLCDARVSIASVINASEEEIFFTSGGTESDNTVIFGIEKLIEDNLLKNKERHIITTKIEHPAVKEPLEYLEKHGWKITWLNVNNEGFIDIEELKNKITSKTSLVSVIHANNEIGTIQNLKTISSICKEKNVLLHSDTIQSFGKIPIDVKELDIDFISMSSHKIYGPKGVGAVYIKSTKKLAPVFIGGPQESGVRPGTENLPGITGFGRAAKLINEEMPKNIQKLRGLQIELMKGFTNNEYIILTGVGLEKYMHRLPGHVSICAKNIEGENLVLQTDLKGIQASSGSACSSGSLEPSHVLTAINIPKDFIRGSLRLTLGRENTEEDVKYIIESITNIVNNLTNNDMLSKTGYVIARSVSDKAIS